MAGSEWIQMQLTQFALDKLRKIRERTHHCHCHCMIIKTANQDHESEALILLASVASKFLFKVSVIAPPSRVIPGILFKAEHKKAVAFGNSEVVWLMCTKSASQGSHKFALASFSFIDRLKRSL